MLSSRYFATHYHLSFFMDMVTVRTYFRSKNGSRFPALYDFLPP